MRLQGGQGFEHLREHPDHHLRIVPPGDLLEDAGRDLDHLAARGLGGLDGLVQQRMAGLRAIEQGAGGVAEFDRLGDDLQALGQEEAALLALFAKVQRPDRLDRRIGQGGDGPAAHGSALQRAKKDSPTARSPPCSTRASSPQSMRPDRPASAWRSRLPTARPEIRSA